MLSCSFGDLFQILSPSSSLFGGGGGCGVRGAAFLCTTNRGKLLQHQLIRVPCTKKVPEYRSPLYRSTGNRLKKLFLSIVFNYTQEKLFLKHTTRTFGFCLRLFTAKSFCLRLFTARNRDHQPKNKPGAFRDIISRASHVGQLAETKFIAAVQRPASAAQRR